MAKKLFEGTENTTPQDTRRIALGYPGIIGSEYIEWKTAQERLLSDIDYITLNTDPPIVTDAGTIIWNKNEYAIDVITGLGATIQVGQETLVLVYNNTGATVNNAKVLHPIGAFDGGSAVGITFEFADASNWEKCQGTLLVSTHDIADSSWGLATRFGKVRDADTSSFTGAQLWLSADGSGDFTETKPQFPNYAISLGGAIKIDSTVGEIFVSILGDEKDTFNDAWDGAIRESFDFRTDASGGVVTGTLKNVITTDNLTLLFSDGFYTLDTTTTDLTITLTSGTDTDTITNYVYIPITTKVLTLSTSGYPTTEHCKIAKLEVQSAATVQADGGVRRNQNINDHLKSNNDNGHILHIAERVRQLNAEHDNGTEGSLTGTTTNGYIQVTSGQVWQMHKQTVPAFSMPTQNILIANDNTTAYTPTNNLNTITEYSDGSTWNNEWSNVVIWGVANKTGEPSFVFCNLPSGGYNSEASAIADSDSYSNYTIPDIYKGVGFLIARFSIRISGGTITYNSSTGYQDLRGTIPNNIAGGGGGGGGVTSYLGLTDTPSSRVLADAGKLVMVNSAGTDDEYTNIILGDKAFISQTDYTLTLQSGEPGINNGETKILMRSRHSYGVNTPSSYIIARRESDTDTKGCDFAIQTRNILGDIADKFIVGSEGIILIVNTPNTGASTDKLLVRASTGEIKQIDQTKNQVSTASSSTPAPTGNYKENEYFITALAANATFSAPSGTAANGNNLMIRIKDNGTARTLTWNAIYDGFYSALPATTTAGKTMYIGFIYNSTSVKWEMVSLIYEA